MKSKNRTDEQLSDDIGEQGIIYKQLKREIAERKSTEEALKKSEDRYKRIIESITDYTYSVRIEDGKALETTHCIACFAVTGYTSEEFAADPYLWIKMVVEEDHDLVRQQAEDILAGLFPRSVEHRIIQKDGVMRWVESSLSPDYDLHGNLISYDGIVRDITDRKNIEIALRESEERFRRLSEATLEGILIHNKGKIIDMNQAFTRIFGYDPAELIKMNALQLIAPDFREAAMEHISSKYEKSYETVGLRKDGSTFPLIIQAKMVKREGQEVRVAACRDISEQKKSEKTLRFLSLVTEQISDSVITTNLDHEITYANQSFQRMFGYSAEEILGKSPDILNAESDSEQIQDDIYKTVSSGGIWRGELMNRKKDGSTFHCGLLVFPLHDEHGNIFAFTGIQRDITGRKKAEQDKELLNSELAGKNRELEQVVYATSHDLRTPLVNIDGFSKELRNSMNDLFSVLQRDDVPSDIKEKISLIVDEDVPEALKYISLSIFKMDSLLAGLLKLSRLGRAELKMEELNINEILSDVSSIFMSQIKKTGAKLEISDLPRCIGDEKQVSQIFSNLIDNAIKYLDPEQPGIIMISGNMDDGQSVYCVEDNGVGIDPQYQERIFEIFRQLEPSRSSGEGLGLTIVRKSVERHNGKIWMNSEPGKGTKFFVSLPAV